MLIFLLLLNVFSSLHRCVVSLSFLVSVMLCRNVSLCFWATVSALVCLVCSSTAVRNYDDDDDDDDDNSLLFPTVKEFSKSVNS